MEYFHIEGSIGSIFSNAVTILDSDTCPKRVHATQRSILWLAPRKVVKCSVGGGGCCNNGICAHRESPSGHNMKDRMSLCLYLHTFAPISTEFGKVVKLSSWGGFF
jgi:hypothetical protein